MARVSFFIDGFNVYHSLKDNPKYKKYLWLDYFSFLQRYLRTNDTLADIFYFSAFAHWRPDSVKIHRLMISAWKDTGVKEVMGLFKDKHKYCPNCNTYFTAHEEKQTDVNIGIYLIKEAFEDTYDTAIIVTNDTDLIPAIRMVKSGSPQKKVGVLFPIDRWSSELAKECHFWKKTRKKRLSTSQFPNPITLQTGVQFSKPPSWN